MSREKIEKSASRYLFVSLQQPHFVASFVLKVDSTTYALDRTYTDQQSG